MSERFLEGYLIDEAALRAMLGTPKVSPKVIRAKAKSVNDIDMTFGNRAVTDRALEALAANKLTSASEYELVRVAALVLEVHGKKLGTIEMPYIDSDAFGLLNPVARAIGCKTMATEYGVPSLAFPFARPAKVRWPIVMKVDAAKWQRDFDSEWKLRLEKLPDAVFTDPKYGLDEDSMAHAREELPGVLDTLAKWTKSAVTKSRELVLVLDGDQ